jgi:hypothetical protein
VGTLWTAIVILVVLWLLGFLVFPCRRGLNPPSFGDRCAARKAASLGAFWENKAPKSEQAPDDNDQLQNLKRDVSPFSGCPGTGQAK